MDSLFTTDQIPTAVIKIPKIKKNAGNPSPTRIQPKTSPITFAIFCTTFMGPDDAFASTSLRFSCSV